MKTRITTGKVNGRAIAISLMLLSLSVLPVQAEGFDLVTVDEHQQAVEAGDNPDHDLLGKSMPGGPAISVLSPIVSEGTVASPVDIEVKFEAADGASIDMSSLRIYYLMFIKKDVTDRILEHAEIGVDSIKSLGAKLPAGRHKFLVEISDTAKRTGSQKFLVNVDA